MRWRGPNLAEPRNKFYGALLCGYLLWNATSVGLLLMLVLRTSFAQYDGGVEVSRFTWHNYTHLYTFRFGSTMLATMKLSAIVALVTTALAVVAVVSIWQVASPTWKQIVMFGLVSVYFAGVIPRTQAAVFLLSPEGPIQFFAARSGPSRELGLLYTQPGIVVGFLPILVPLAVAILAVFRYNIPEVYPSAARDLGATPFQVTTRVIAPLLVPGIVISCLLCFVLVLGDMTVVDLLDRKSVV